MKEDSYEEVFFCGFHLIITTRVDTDNNPNADNIPSLSLL